MVLDAVLLEWRDMFHCPFDSPMQQLSGDDQVACVLLVWVEFQVVDKIACGYLIGHDVFRPHEAIIDEGAGQIIFSCQNPPFKIPITNRDHFNK